MTNGQIREEIEKARHAPDLISMIKLVEEALISEPNDVWLGHRLVLALARTGELERAKQEYRDRRLARKGNGEIYRDRLSLKARLIKDEAILARSEGVYSAKRLFAKAAEAYAFGYRKFKDSYNAVNAATMYKLAGRLEDMLKFAGIAINEAHAVLDGRREVQEGDSRYFYLATLTEAHLLLDRKGQAMILWKEALANLAGRWDELATTLRQFSLFLDREQLRFFTADVPTVGVFLASIDGSQQEQAVENEFFYLRFDFSPSPFRQLVSFVRNRHGLHRSYFFWRKAIPQTLYIAEKFYEIASSISFSIENSLEIPFEFFSDSDLVTWRILKSDSARHVDHAAWQNRYVLGAACLEASRLYQVPQVFDLNIGKVSLEAWGALINEPPHSSDRADNIPVAVLMGDFSGFSKLPDQDLSFFVDDYLKPIAPIVKGYSLVHNTWGDGLFLVYDNVIKAAETAIGTQTRVRKITTLPVELRIAGHFGFAQCLYDPIKCQQNYYGSTISRAARMEPKTNPGQIFVSEEFAKELALVQLVNLSQRFFVLTYIGPKELEKGYGTFELYRLEVI